MKEIKLANTTEVALVDDEDFEFINQYSWHFRSQKIRYASSSIKIDGKRLNKLMHRLIMKVSENEQIDHIDGNKLNNQKNNLRIATKSQNRMNIPKFKNKSSIYKGVSWSTNRNKWWTEITFEGKTYFLGRFKSEEEAAKAYNKKAIELFGEFANLNIIEE